MSTIFYRNFDIQILRAGEEYLAQTESPDAGNASLNFTLPFSEDGLDALLSKLGPARRVRGVGTPIEAAKRLGGQLYKAVFSAGIGSALDRSIEAAKRESQRLRIRLRLTNVPELANLPWEYLYDEPNDRFLALSYKTSIVRYLGVPQPVNPLAVKPPLRVLVMASSPIGYDALGVDKEWSNLQTALGKMPRGLVEVDRTEKATLEALQERLSGGNQYHIFHYIGHGGFDPRTGKSVLVMEDDRRQARFVDGPQLGVLLHNHPSLRLAILNACEGAVSNQNDVFAGVAQNLIRQEVPAVIAMQFEITDSVAIILAKAFYESLARNAPVDTALAEARLAVFAADDGIEWGTPVLYLRAHDGRLFDVEPQPPPIIKTTETTEQTTEMNLPSGLNEPARRERERFEAAYKAFLREIQEVSLSILVWGPNPQSDSPIARKRNEIREELESLGHNAMFSEDLSIQTGNISEKSKEFAQARAAHLIIILVEDAPGALAEAHDFCNHPDIAPNVYVMIPQKYKKGYSARGAIKDLSDGHGGVYWYKDEDLHICNVCKQAVKRAEARRRMLCYYKREGTRL